MTKHPEFFVYILYHPTKNEPRYVGKGSKDRPRQHWFSRNNHHNAHLRNLMEKYGELPHEIVFRTDNEEEAFIEERRLISMYGRKDNKTGILCNFTDGGEGPSGSSRPHTEETKEKMRMVAIKNKNFENLRPFLGSRKGFTMSEEQKEKLRTSSSGKTHSDHSKKLVSDSKKEIWADPERRPAMEDHCRKIAQKGADAIKERWKDPEFRAAQIAKRKGKKRTPEQCERIRQARLNRVLSDEAKEERKRKMIERGTWRGD